MGDQTAGEGKRGQTREGRTPLTQRPQEAGWGEAEPSEFWETESWNPHGWSSGLRESRRWKVKPSSWDPETEVWSSYVLDWLGWSPYPHPAEDQKQ